MVGQGGRSSECCEGIAWVEIEVRVENLSYFRRRRTISTLDANLIGDAYSGERQNAGSKDMSGCARQMELMPSEPQAFGAEMNI